MSELVFFDSTCALGRWSCPGARLYETADELLADMDYHKVAEALVFHNAAREADADTGNEELLKIAQGRDRLHPSWVLAPEHFGGGAPAQLVEGMLARGVRAARLYPRLHNIRLSGWFADPLLSELEEHRVPTFIDYGNRHWSERYTDWNAVEGVCSRFPELPIVMVHEGIIASRIILALARRYRNLHAELSYFQPFGGIEFITSQLGAKQLIFGSGAPEWDPGLPMSMVAYSRIDPSDRAAIAGGNLRRLLEGVR